MKFSSILIIILLLLGVCNNTKAQSRGRGKKSLAFMLSAGGGIAGGDYGGLSAYGPNVMLEGRKVISRIGNSFSFTFDNHLSVFTGFFETYPKTSFALLPSVASAIDFNAYTGAGRKSRSPAGGFLGVGVYSTLAPQVVLPNYNSNYSNFDIGPYINLGLRFKTGKKNYLSIKFFGGFTVIQEMGYGGLNILMSIRTNKRKFSRKDDCGC